MADAYYHQLENTLVVAPTDSGRLDFVASRRAAVLNRDLEAPERVLARWVFSDLPRATLQDQWGNRYDHQALHLVVGTLAEGRRFVKELRDSSFDLREEPKLFVPLKTVDLQSESDSDNLRLTHARAFAVAIRRLPRVADLVAEARDRGVVGG